MRILLLLSSAMMLLAEGKPDGEWAWKMSSPFGELKARAIMKTEDGKLTGTFWMDESRKLEIVDGTVTGDKIKFTLKRDRPSGGSMTYEMTGTVKSETGKEDTIEGNATSVEMSASQAWTATRKKE